MCENSEDLQELNNLILQKVRSLKSVPNLYVKDTTPYSKIILDHRALLVTEDDTYAEVFDSLNIEPSPPPLPSRSSVAKAPARPPYPSSMLRRKVH